MPINNTNIDPKMNRNRYICFPIFLNLYNRYKFTKYNSKKTKAITPSISLILFDSLIPSSKAITISDAKWKVYADISFSKLSHT